MLGKIKGWIKRARNRLVDFHNSRFVTNLFTMDPESFKVNFDYAFNEAKALSDFVAMIVRLVFAQFAFRYFFNIASKHDFIYEIVFSICGVFALGLTCILFARISFVIFLWEVREIPLMNDKKSKVLLFIISVIATGVIYAGTIRLVTDLATASDIFNQPSAPG